jgi:hypothetical protein
MLVSGSGDEEMTGVEAVATGSGIPDTALGFRELNRNQPTIAPRKRHRAMVIP